jgi:hypothetical protein
MGLVGTIAALVLGLLIASAKGSYDAQSAEVTQLAANVAMLDRALALFLACRVDSICSGLRPLTAPEAVLHVLSTRDTALKPLASSDGSRSVTVRLQTEDNF